MVSITFLPEALRRTRHEGRLTLVRPLRLTSGLGDTIPAVLLNLSPSGLLALVDTRSSPLLPPPPGTCFTAEFFLDELEIRDAEVEVIRTKERDNGLVLLGCTLMARPEERTAIRAKITASLAPLRPPKGKA